MKKQAISIGIIVILIGGIWYFMSSSNTPQTNAISPNQASPTQTTDQTNQQTNTDVSVSTDSSNTGIDQDVKAVDSQLQNLGTDSTNANQSVSVNPAI